MELKTGTYEVEVIHCALGEKITAKGQLFILMAKSVIVEHGEPAGRLIVSKALTHRTAVITDEEKLRATPDIRSIG